MPRADRRPELLVLASWAIGAAAIGRRTALRCRKGLEDPPAPLRHLRDTAAQVLQEITLPQEERKDKTNFNRDSRGNVD